MTVDIVSACYCQAHVSALSSCTHCCADGSCKKQQHHTGMHTQPSYSICLLRTRPSEQTGSNPRREAMLSTNLTRLGESNTWRRATMLVVSLQRSTLARVSDQGGILLQNTAAVLFGRLLPGCTPHRHDVIWNGDIDCLGVQVDGNLWQLAKKCGVVHTRRVQYSVF